MESDKPKLKLKVLYQNVLPPETSQGRPRITNTVPQTMPQTTLREKSYMPFIQLTKQAISTLDSIIQSLTRKAAELQEQFDGLLTRKVEQAIKDLTYFSAIRQFDCRWKYDQAKSECFQIRTRMENISRQAFVQRAKAELSKQIISNHNEYMKILEQESMRLANAKQQLQRITELDPGYLSSLKQIIEEAKSAVLHYSSQLQKSRLMTDASNQNFLKGNFKVKVL